LLASHSASAVGASKWRPPQLAQLAGTPTPKCNFRTGKCCTPVYDNRKIYISDSFNFRNKITNVHSSDPCFSQIPTSIMTSKVYFTCNFLALVWDSQHAQLAIYILKLLIRKMYLACRLPPDHLRLLFRISISRLDMESRMYVWTHSSPARISRRFSSRQKA
jgi:hypothetical protein